MELNSTIVVSMSKRILFIHHSTGGNLIKEGNLREEIRKLNPSIEFWDHSYNLYKIFPLFLANFTHHKGLSDNNGSVIGKDYNIVLSNNSPKEYADIFSRDPSDPTLHSILNFDVIAFKNCYPTTRITSDQQLQEDIKYYEQIRESLKRFPEKQFILVTPPPARANTTNKESAHRAKKLVEWLRSKEFLNGTRNIHVFDFFTLLADENGVLKREYERLFPWDSHPNKKANEDIAKIFARYLVKITNS